MITSLYAGLLALLYMFISMDVINARKKHKISLGAGTNDEIASLVSAHLNFASYAIFLLLLIFLVEHSGVVPVILLHIVGLAFTIGRFCHFFAFRSEKMNFKLRVVGMHLTLWPLVILGFVNLYCFAISIGS